jgi:hypothetical protein
MMVSGDSHSPHRSTRMQIDREDALLSSRAMRDHPLAGPSTLQPSAAREKLGLDAVGALRGRCRRRPTGP